MAEFSSPVLTTTSPREPLPINPAEQIGMVAVRSNNENYITAVERFAPEADAREGFPSHPGCACPCCVIGTHMLSLLEIGNFAQ